MNIPFVLFCQPTAPHSPQRSRGPRLNLRMKSISLDSPESSDTTTSTGVHIRPTGSGPTLSSVGKASDGAGRRYGGLLNVIRTRVGSGTLNPITSPSSSSTTTSSSCGGAARRMVPPTTVNIGATSAPASYNQCKKAFSVSNCWFFQLVSLFLHFLSFPPPPLIFLPIPTPTLMYRASQSFINAKRRPNPLLLLSSLHFFIDNWCQKYPPK